MTFETVAGKGTGVELERARKKERRTEGMFLRICIVIEISSFAVNGLDSIEGFCLGGWLWLR